MKINFYSHFHYIFTAIVVIFCVGYTTYKSIYLERNIEILEGNIKRYNEYVAQYEIATIEYNQALKELENFKWFINLQGNKEYEPLLKVLSYDKRDESISLLKLQLSKDEKSN